MVILDEVIDILREVLELGPRADSFDASTPLFYALPELDSMGLIMVVSAIEQRFDVLVEPDELTEDVFENVGRLCGFVEHKLGV